MEDDGVTVTMPKGMYEKLKAAQPEKIIINEVKYKEIRRGSCWGGVIAMICATVSIVAMFYFNIHGWGWYLIPAFSGLSGAVVQADK
jgi:fatty acid desaturase